MGSSSERGAASVGHPCNVASVPTVGLSDMYGSELTVCWIHGNLGIQALDKNKRGSRLGCLERGREGARRHLERFCGAVRISTNAT